MKILLIGLLFISINAFAFKVAIISDLNSSYGSTKYNQFVKKTIHQIVIENPDLVISTGDMIAGQKANLNYTAMWNSFHSNITNHLQNNGIPFAITPGNHDGSGSLKFKQKREIFISQWKKHKPNLNYISDKYFPEFYAFVVKNTLFISLDATVPGKLSLKQKNWLSEVLKHSTHYQHKIIFGHLPIIPTVKAKENETIVDSEFEKIINHYNVQMYISGHQHAYFPGKEKKLKHLGMACLGSGPRKLFGESKRSQRSFVVLNIDKDLSYQAFDVENGFKSIQLSDLPKSIKVKDRELLRDDLARK